MTFFINFLLFQFQCDKNHALLATSYFCSMDASE